MCTITEIPSKQSYQVLQNFSDCVDLIIAGNKSQIQRTSLPIITYFFFRWSGRLLTMTKRWLSNPFPPRSLRCWSKRGWTGFCSPQPNFLLLMRYRRRRLYHHLPSLPWGLGDQRFLRLFWFCCMGYMVQLNLLWHITNKQNIKEWAWRLQGCMSESIQYTEHCVKNKIYAQRTLCGVCDTGLGCLASRRCLAKFVVPSCWWCFRSLGCLVGRCSFSSLRCCGGRRYFRRFGRLA